MLPVLVDQPGRSSANTEVRDGQLVPAEWLASLRSAPTEDDGFVLQLGGGTGIPLSSETRDGASDQFAGVTTPRFRLVFVVRYAPGKSPKGDDPGKSPKGDTPSPDVKTPARGRRSHPPPGAGGPANAPR
jgi:hypothetical protein